MSNEKKNTQLGMPIGTAGNRLRKEIMFKLLTKLNENICYRCGKKIESAEELSIEHKEPWLDSPNPKELFFDLENIAFSHLSCNIHARRMNWGKHPSTFSYKKGCRCAGCVKANREMVYKYRQKKKQVGLE